MIGPLQLHHVHDEGTARNVGFTPLHHYVVTSTVPDGVLHTEEIFSEVFYVYLLTGHNWPRHSDIENVIA